MTARAPAAQGLRKAEKLSGSAPGRLGEEGSGAQGRGGAGVGGGTSWDLLPPDAYNHTSLMSSGSRWEASSALLPHAGAALLCWASERAKLIKILYSYSAPRAGLKDREQRLQEF